MDLIYGLPGQGVAEVEDSARFAAANGADRVAVFGYADVPWMKSHQKAIKLEDLPDAPLRMVQAEAAARVLAEAGYVAIGLDHFARPEDAIVRAAASGRLRRNFQGYTTDEAPVLLGLGASAIGRCRAGFFKNNRLQPRDTARRFRVAPLQTGWSELVHAISPHRTRILTGARKTPLCRAGSISHGSVNQSRSRYKLSVANFRFRRKC
jgi:coproporphyrinogen III oxidase-like Fe-S oxidoreductase